jgi:hypothetical protein
MPRGEEGRKSFTSAKCYVILCLTWSEWAHLGVQALLLLQVTYSGANVNVCEFRKQGVGLGAVRKRACRKFRWRHGGALHAVLTLSDHIGTKSLYNGLPDHTLYSAPTPGSQDQEQLTQALLPACASINHVSLLSMRQCRGLGAGPDSYRVNTLFTSMQGPVCVSVAATVRPSQPQRRTRLRSQPQLRCRDWPIPPLPSLSKCRCQQQGPYLS